MLIIRLIQQNTIDFENDLKKKTYTSSYFVNKKEFSKRTFFINIK
jgi:hypothetical protein